MRDFVDASLRGDMGLDGNKSEFHKGCIMTSTKSMSRQ